MLQLYKNIKSLREALGYSQDYLAKKVGYTDRSSIAKIEAGLVDITQSKIEAFAEALGTTPGELMGWEQAPSELSSVLPSSGDTIKNAPTRGEDAVLDPETLEVMEYYRTKPGMKLLFSVTKDATPEDIIATAEQIEELKNKRRQGE